MYVTHVATSVPSSSRVSPLNWPSRPTKPYSGGDILSWPSPHPSRAIY